MTDPRRVAVAVLLVPLTVVCGAVLLLGATALAFDTRPTREPATASLASERGITLKHRRRTLDVRAVELESACPVCHKTVYTLFPDRALWFSDQMCRAWVFCPYEACGAVSHIKNWIDE